MFGPRTTSFDELLKRPRRSTWHDFLRAPSVFVARRLYVWQRHVPAALLANAVSVVCISDTHNSQLAVPDGDVLIHAGDLTQFGTLQELQVVLAWLRSLPHVHKIVVAGNHDVLLDAARDDPAGAAERQRHQLAWGDIVYLEDEAATIACANGRRLRVYGSPRSPKHGRWAFQYPRADDVWAGRIPQHLEILITHGPPRAHLDLLHLGCIHLLAELWRARPALHVCGHVHEGYGCEWLNFDDLQRAYEHLVMSNGGLLNLLRVVREFLRTLFVPPKEARCRLVNASSVGGLRDDERRTPFGLFI